MGLGGCVGGGVRGGVAVHGIIGNAGNTAYTGSFSLFYLVLHSPSPVWTTCACVSWCSVSHLISYHPILYLNHLYPIHISVLPPQPRVDQLRLRQLVRWEGFAGAARAFNKGPWAGPLETR